VNPSKIKQRVLAAELIAILSVLVMAWAAANNSGWHLLLQLQFPLVVGTFWLYLARLKCPHCARRLSRDFPTGALTMLPFSKQPCKNCSRSL
jgi:hypothetical protein